MMTWSSQIGRCACTVFDIGHYSSDQYKYTIVHEASIDNKQLFVSMSRSSLLPYYTLKISL